MNYKNIALIFSIICCSTSHIIFSNYDSISGIKGTSKENSLAEKKLELYQTALENNRKMKAKLIFNEGQVSNANVCFFITMLCAIGAGMSVATDGFGNTFKAFFTTGSGSGVIGLVASHNQQSNLQSLDEEEKQILQSINMLSE